MNKDISYVLNYDGYLDVNLAAGKLEKERVYTPTDENGVIEVEVDEVERVFSTQISQMKI